MHQSTNKFRNQKDGRRHGSNTANVSAPTNPQQLLNGYDAASNSSAQNGECVVCTRNAICVCQRCGDYYCSPECQRKDWPAHRYICFPMPTLVRAGVSISKHVEPTLSLLNTSNDNITNGIAALEPNSNNRKRQQQPQQEQQQQQPPQQQQQQQQLNATHKSHASIQLPPPSSPIPKHNSRVVLTGFRSPNRCYVRSLATSELEGFMLVARAIDSYGKTAPPLTQLPQQNSYAITHLDPNGVMYRVQILAARANAGIRVLFLDNGSTAVRQLSELREISDEILKLQQHTIQIQLKNVDNYALNDKLLNFLAQFEDCEFKLQYCREDDGRAPNYFLRHWQSDELLNDQITQFGSKMDVFLDNNSSRKNDATSTGAIPKSSDKAVTGSEFVSERTQALKRKQQINRETASQSTVTQPKPDAVSSSSSNIEPVMNPPFETRTTLVESTQNIDTVVVDNSCLELGYFACVERKDIVTFAEVQKYLADFEDTGKPYKPRLHEYCIAKFEGDWYRAKVTTIPKDNQYTVLYIDYTNEHTVSSSDIRPYPLNLKQDCTTNMCLIDGLPTDIDEKLFKYLQARVPLNNMIKIDKVKSVDDQIIIVELSWLIKKMQSDGVM